MCGTLMGKRSVVCRLAFESVAAQLTEVMRRTAHVLRLGGLQPCQPVCEHQSPDRLVAPTPPVCLGLRVRLRSVVCEERPSLEDLGLQLCHVLTFVDLAVEDMNVLWIDTATAAGLRSSARAQAIPETSLQLGFEITQPDLKPFLICRR